ncbi:MAG: DUF3107 domain-containing protein [Acidimicrobiaceae bacterium]|nr:DUF3107 domain-containing protein [Acidimicrobiaceae bacterium]
MEVRVGITQSMKELEVEFPEGTDREALQRQVEEALSADAVLWMTDRKGRRVGVPAQRIAYVEITNSSDRVVGFGTA